ncbi:MAG: hypothetical protein GY801_13785, partial [bacterium]|nr:hypothetical protein [bacterium]
MTAVVSIAVLESVISWKFSESIAQQSEKLVADMTNQAYETLSYPHRMFEVWSREKIRNSANDLRKNPSIIADLEIGQILSLISTLKKVAETKDLDFAMLFNAKGQLQASFPSGLNDIEVEKHVYSWELGAHAQSVLEGDTPQNTILWDAVSRHEPDALQAFGLSHPDISGKASLSIAAAGIVENDFGDVIGFCVVGKLVNRHDEFLKQISDTTGFAVMVNFDTVPIAQAGFEHPEEEGVALSTLQIPPDVQTAIYHADEKKNLKLPLAGQSYLVTCSALQSLNDENVGILCIGVPEAHVLQSQYTIRAQGIIMKQSVQMWMLGVGIASLTLFVVISLVVATKIVNPLKQLSEISKKIAT